MDSLLESRVYLAEAYPQTNINLGAGSLALYLGCKPEFREDTIWFEPTVEEWKTHAPLSIDRANRWWNHHITAISRQVELSGGRYLVNIPDLVENIDILSALRGPQRLCFDLLDEPEEIERRRLQVDDAFEEAYDEFYSIIKGGAGSSSFTAFRIWGPGKTAKIQCDFAALIGPDQFRDFVVPSLKRQCEFLDYTLYHLDGPDAIRHLPALMEIEQLNALQWTPGAGQADGAAEEWYPIYEQARAAGKSLHISVYDGSYDDMWNGCSALVSRFGPEGLYVLLPAMPETIALQFLERANSSWR